MVALTPKGSPGYDPNAPHPVVILAFCACDSSPLTDHERTLLSDLALRPPPRSPTNSFADDSRAAALGQELFFVYKNRLLVVTRWTFSFVTHGRGARLITENPKTDE